MSEKLSFIGGCEKVYNLQRVTSEQEVSMQDAARKRWKKIEEAEARQSSGENEENMDLILQEYVHEGRVKNEYAIDGVKSCEEKLGKYDEKSGKTAKPFINFSSIKRKINKFFDLFLS